MYQNATYPPVEIYNFLYNSTGVRWRVGFQPTPAFGNHHHQVVMITFILVPIMITASAVIITIRTTLQILSIFIVFPLL